YGVWCFRWECIRQPVAIWARPMIWRLFKTSDPAGCGSPLPRGSSRLSQCWAVLSAVLCSAVKAFTRSEEHTSELQSRFDLVCRFLLEKKKHMQKPRDNQNV